MRRLSLAALALACNSPPTPPPAPAPTPPVQARSAPPAASRSRSFSWGSEVAIASPDLAPPYTLTASDGTGLALVSLQARGVVEDPLAFTELRLVFENPRDRAIEGNFRVTLPQGASVSRFAMKIGDKFQEGEVVELQAARRAYEDFLHRRQDPALLEMGAANEFQARVFPIGPRERKEIILSYSQELQRAGEAYRIPLRGLPQLGVLDVRVLVGAGGNDPRVVADRQERIVPDKDFVVEQVSVPGRAGLRAGDLMVARVRPVAQAEPDEIASLLLLVDTSASRALGYDEELRMVEALVKGLRAGAGDVPLAVMAFDQDVEIVFQGTAAGFGPEAIDKLRKRRALGASDLAGALRKAAAMKGYRRAVLVTDGVATAGPVEAAGVKDAAKALAAAGIERLDAVALGGIRDEALLASIVTAGLSRDGVVADGSLPLPRVAEKLTRRTRSGIEVKVAGADWRWPARLDGIQDGDEVLVYAQVPAGKPVEIVAGDASLRFAGAELASAAPPLVQRAAAKAQIAQLEAAREALPAGDKARAALKETIIEVSRRQRVVSRFTALLVLETEEDYARFGIDRKALADILTVGDGGIQVLHRTDAPIAVVRPANRGGKDGYKAEKQKPKDTADKPEDTGALDEGFLGKVEAKGEGEVEKRLEAAPNADLSVADPSPGPAGGARADRAPSQQPVATPPVEAPPPPAPEPPARRPPPASESRPAPGANQPAEQEPAKVPAWTGKFAEIMRLVQRGRAAEAVAQAQAWRAEDPADVLALVALGEALEKSGDLPAAARAYGSLIDLFPARADLRRFAGQRLDRIDAEAARALAVDTFGKAAEQRADHPASHRLYAFALLRAGKPAEAFAAMEKGVRQSYPDGRFAGHEQILAEDLGLLAAAWIKAEPARKPEILGRLRQAGGKVESGPSLRFVLVWETDANDVDFHIRDAKGNHAYYSNRELASGGVLYADVTTGYGPEEFTIRGPRANRAYPYRLQAHYYSRGPMGYGMGKLEIIEHDGRGGLKFEQRPFVVMNDHAFVDLGTVKR